MNVALALPDLAELRAAAAVVHATMPPTPQYRWPLLEQAMGTGLGGELWVKHENHTPLGAFKVRGGLVYFERLMREGVCPSGVVSATRGNHGQSVGFAARRYGLPATIFVPHGNSTEKNAAMRAQGAQLIEVGDDFQAAREAAAEYATRHGSHMVPSFHHDLVAGVASYALELFDAVQPDVVYVSIGMGSGACALIAARDALGLKHTQIVGVVSEGAPAYALSFERGESVTHAVTTTLADGMACRMPDPQALQHMRKGLSRIVLVSDAQVAQAMRTLYETTHQVAEGAGAAPLAAAWAERHDLVGRRAAVVLTGGNVDRPVFARVLAAP